MTVAVEGTREGVLGGADRAAVVKVDHDILFQREHRALIAVILDVIRKTDEVRFGFDGEADKGQRDFLIDGVRIGDEPHFLFAGVAGEIAEAVHRTCLDQTVFVSDVVVPTAERIEISLATRPIRGVAVLHGRHGVLDADLHFVAEFVTVADVRNVALDHDLKHAVAQNAEEVDAELIVTLHIADDGVFAV